MCSWSRCSVNGVDGVNSVDSFPVTLYFKVDLLAFAFASIPIFIRIRVHNGGGGFHGGFHVWSRLVVPRLACKVDRARSLRQHNHSVRERPRLEAGGPRLVGEADALGGGHCNPVYNLSAWLPSRQQRQWCWRGRQHRQWCWQWWCLSDCSMLI